MRINKYLALRGLATRRGADDIIARGSVRINGRIAVLGDKVLQTDIVEVAGKAAQKKYAYFAYHKPVGIITHSPERGEKDIKTSIPMKNVFPIGRLDKASSGLLILTNDGRITDRLLNPDYAHEKEYRVRVTGPLRAGFKNAMERGVSIEGYVTKPCVVNVTGDRTFTVTLTEGKKHQIRRMVSALYNTVVELERTRILNIRLDKLATGTWRAITGEELTTFLSQIGLK